MTRCKAFDQQGRRCSLMRGLHRESVIEYGQYLQRCLAFICWILPPLTAAAPRMSWQTISLKIVIISLTRPETSEANGPKLLARVIYWWIITWKSSKVDTTLYCLFIYVPIPCNTIESANSDYSLLSSYSFSKSWGSIVIWSKDVIALAMNWSLYWIFVCPHFSSLIRLFS